MIGFVYFKIVKMVLRYYVLAGSLRGELFIGVNSPYTKKKNMYMRYKNIDTVSAYNIIEIIFYTEELPTDLVVNERCTQETKFFHNQTFC